MSAKDEQGYLILAVNTAETDYVTCAVKLAQSLRRFHQHCKICLLTDKPVQLSEFDYVEILPRGDLGGFHNDWQCWLASPFHETIKLEADMLITSPIDHWWHLLRHRDIVISTGCRDFYDNTSQSRFYRRAHDSNSLPDVYNAVTYWRISETAQEFWRWVRIIFQEWKNIRGVLKFPDQDASTDLVYAMAADCVGRDKVIMPFASYPRIVHMKRHVVPIQGTDWTQELVWENLDDQLRIQTMAQWGCVHYHIKDWLIREQQ